MHRPKILAKSALLPEQIAAKEEIGCDGLEYQLLPSDFSDNFREFLDMRGKMGLVEEHPAHAVHPPLNNSRISDIAVPSNCPILETSMRLAQLSSEVRHDRSIAIIHADMAIHEYDWRTLRDIEKELGRLFKLFPDVDIAVENTPPFSGPDGGLPEFANGHYDANVRFVESMPYEGRLFTCLDICHAQMTGMYLDALARIYDPVHGFQFDYSLEGFFEMNARHLGLIHLATFTGNGYRKGHGTGFDRSSGEGMETLAEVLNLYGKHGLACPITAEVREDDFIASVIYRKSKAAIDAELSERIGSDS